MLFEQTDSKGSSVDPEVVHMETKQSGNEQDSDGEKGNKANKDETNSNTRAEPPPKR